MCAAARRDAARPRGGPWRPAGRWRRGRTACAGAASAGTDFGTPWAENTTGRVVRHLVELLDEHRALALQLFDHVAVVHDLVADIDRRAVARSASSTIWMARSTPAQKPRGPASRMRSGGKLWVVDMVRVGYRRAAELSILFARSIPWRPRSRPPCGIRDARDPVSLFVCHDAAFL